VLAHRVPAWPPPPRCLCVLVTLLAVFGCAKAAGPPSPAGRGGTSAGAGGRDAAATGGGSGRAAGGAGEAGGGGGFADGGQAAAGGITSPPEPPWIDSGELRAFPGAEGFGRDALGGRGGDVCHVTTLSDAGPGSLRNCLTEGNRTIVFDVGGWITLESNLGVTQNNVTIAGQTAPGTGIGIRGGKVSVAGDHIVMRYLRVRRGILVTGDRDDAMTVSSESDNVIIDHCSVSFGTDETLSMPGDEGRGPHNFTLQWSIVAWGLQRNNHSAGALFTSNQTTIHHSLWAFNKTRNPRARSETAETRGLGGHLDWVNNVIYGWNAPDPVGQDMGWSLSFDPFILAGTSNGQHSANAVGNYFVSVRSAEFAFTKGTPNFSLFFENNLLDGNANGELDASKDDVAMIDGEPTLLDARLDSPEVTTHSPEQAHALVLSLVGANFPMRDELDALLVSQVQAQTGILIQSERDLIGLGVGDDGYGSLQEATRPADFDTDADGMPDGWEDAHGLDPADAADGNGDTDDDGYTNLEEYLNALL
jgi:hypothetical protein